MSPAASLLQEQGSQLIAGSPCLTRFPLYVSVVFCFWEYLYCRRILDTGAFTAYAIVTTAVAHFLESMIHVQLLGDLAGATEEDGCLENCCPLVLPNNNYHPQTNSSALVWKMGG